MKLHRSECWNFQDLDGFNMSVILLIPPVESTEVSLSCNNSGWLTWSQAYQFMMPIMFLHIHTKRNTVEILAPILYSYRVGKLATQVLKS